MSASFKPVRIGYATQFSLNELAVPLTTNRDIRVYRKDAFPEMTGWPANLVPVYIEGDDPQGPFAAGVWAAVKAIEKRRDDYIREHGITDTETGTVEFPGGGEEYVAELDEIVESLQAIAKGGA